MKERIVLQKIIAMFLSLLILTVIVVVGYMFF
jgi:hypothetical protein